MSIVFNKAVLEPELYRYFLPKNQSLIENSTTN